jgi:CheY-like chemotaxis protein
MPRILVVDDDPLAAEATAHLIEDLGYPDTVVADSAQRAMAGVRTFPDVVVVAANRQSGAIDGVSLAREIRAASDVPIIFLAPYHDAAPFTDAVSTLRDGFVRVLARPIGFESLHSAIDHAIRTRVWPIGPLA